MQQRTVEPIDDARVPRIVAGMQERIPEQQQEYDQVRFAQQSVYIPVPLVKEEIVDVKQERVKEQSGYISVPPTKDEIVVVVQDTRARATRGAEC